MENGQAIFCNKGGTEALFESMGKSIDSFCIVRGLDLLQCMDEGEGTQQAV